jgi:hypothetical protein
MPDPTPHKPTPAKRKMVRNMAIAGVPTDTIRKIMEIGSKTTLYKHYRADLEQGKAEMLGQVAGRLFENAMHDDGRISNPAAMFIMKTQAGWREKSDVNVTSDDGSMSPRSITVVGVDAESK